MELELFSCRNCIQNPCNGLNIGKGQGFCLQHNSVIVDPSSATCKYLHRKDLPFFSVEEGIREHAAEFTEFYGITNLYEKKPIPKTYYSEKHYWETRHFDPLLHAMAQYHRLGGMWEDEDSGLSGMKWRYIQSFAGAVGGIRAIVHPSLVRRYTANCGSWKSSYRLILAHLQDIDIEPYIPDSMLYNNNSHNGSNEIKEQALYEIIFSRFSAIQEYGWHASIKDLMWAPSTLTDFLIDEKFEELWVVLKDKKLEWEEKIIDLAKKENVYFPEDESPTSR